MANLLCLPLNQNISDLRIPQESENHAVGISQSLVTLSDRGVATNPEDTENWKFLTTVVDQTRAIFDRVTDEKCSVCIKLIGESDQSTNNRSISTYIRDPHSNNQRNYVDRDTILKNYALVGNTAFRTITDSHSDDRAFICNDLKALAAEGHYQNANPNWAKYYNACAVVPICTPGSDVRDTLFGFICVDNLGGGFDEDICIPILKIIANNVQIFMLEYSEKSILMEADPQQSSGQKTERIANVTNKKTPPKSTKGISKGG